MKISNTYSSTKARVWQNRKISFIVKSVFQLSDVEKYLDLDFYYPLNQVQVKRGSFFCQ